MRIRILGAGFYGCHIAAAFLRDGHEVEVHEKSDRIFAGASGGIPARLHLGFHYPRSQMTRTACQEHRVAFMARYGQFTRGVPVNLYAVAAQDSLVDFGNYCQVLSTELQFVVVDRPEEFGLQHVEGAVLTGERHILTDKVRDHFECELAGHVKYGIPAGVAPDPTFDWTIDCTFCANGGANVQRYEPCVTALLQGPTERAVTVMDGPFPSIYPWDEGQGLSSLTSAKFTPIARMDTYQAAEAALASTSAEAIDERVERMFDQIAHFWPAARDLYKVVGVRLSIRAMPRSGCDARLVEVVNAGERILRIRAGKIDAILHAEAVVRQMMGETTEAVLH